MEVIISKSRMILFDLSVIELPEYYYKINIGNHYIKEGLTNLTGRSAFNVGMRHNAQNN